VLQADAAMADLKNMASETTTQRERLLIESAKLEQVVAFHFTNDQFLL
jgi:hypothetical protein